MPDTPESERVVKSIRVVTEYEDGTEDVTFVGPDQKALVVSGLSSREGEWLAELCKVTKYAHSHSAYTVQVEPKLLANAIRILRSRGVEVPE